MFLEIGHCIFNFIQTPGKFKSFGVSQFVDEIGCCLAVIFFLYFLMIAVEEGAYFFRETLFIIILNKFSVQIFKKIFFELLHPKNSLQIVIV